MNIKSVYFSSNYVSGIKGNYKETDPLLPSSKKLSNRGEAAVHIYNNSLILRVCMTEKPLFIKKH